MNGRDLILYILMNNLEEKEVIDENGVFIGFMTIEDAAVKSEVGVATVKILIYTGQIKAVRIADKILIPATEKRPNP